MIEENLTDKGYKEGFKQGISEGNTEGYHLGYHRGAEIGAELGYFLSIINFNLQRETDPTKEKNQKYLRFIKETIENFPQKNDERVDIIKELENIRSLFKKACALLKIDSTYPESDKLSF